MATLKGQNFRVFASTPASPTNYQVIAMAATCSITMQNTTEELSHKDIVSMASLPVVTSKSWSVSVESLNVLDAGTILQTIQNKLPFTVVWDETDNDDNQTMTGAGYSKKGQAYMTDVTFNFNDRELSTKSIQFTGTGKLLAASEEETVVSIGDPTRGQYVRLFLSTDNTAAPSAVVGAAKQLALHVSVSLEAATTKDTDTDFQIQEPTGISYDITTNALVQSNDVITSSVQAKDLSSFEAFYVDGNPIKWKIANVSGANNRTAGTSIVHGSAILTQLQINAPNRQAVDYTATLTGYGDYEVG